MMDVRSILLLAFLAAGCREARAHDPEVGAPASAPSAAAIGDAGGSAVRSDASGVAVAVPAPPAGPAEVMRLPVPGDVAASLVRSVDGGPPTTIFVPGLCSNANAYLQAFPEAARRQGGVVAIEGDQPCAPGLVGYRSFSWDAPRLHARIEAAATAAGLTTVPREGLTLVGYSQGAALAEQLVQRWPARYTRIVLIGAPTDPSAAKLAPARAVVTMSCARDVPWRMKEATARFVRAGIPSTYVEMPACTHGNIADGDVVFDKVFDWLRRY